MKAVRARGYIELDDVGRAWVAGTNTKVIEIVLDRIAYGWDADEMHAQHPHLPLAKIHAALSYYFDHQAEIDRQIADDAQHVEEAAAKVADSPGRLRLRERGLL